MERVKGEGIFDDSNLQAPAWVAHLPTCLPAPAYMPTGPCPSVRTCPHVCLHLPQGWPRAHPPARTHAIPHAPAWYAHMPACSMTHPRATPTPICVARLSASTHHDHDVRPSTSTFLSPSVQVRFNRLALPVNPLR